MTGSFSLRNAEEKVNLKAFSKLIKHYAKERKLSVSDLNSLLCQKKGYIGKKLLNESISLAMVYGLSIHLHQNLFEPFIGQLPADIRSTPLEKEQANQIAALQQQLAQVGRERDLLVGVMKR